MSILTNLMTIVSVLYGAVSTLLLRAPLRLTTYQAQDCHDTGCDREFAGKPSLI